MQFQRHSNIAIIIGGNSAIAQACVDQLLINDSVDAILILSRSAPPKRQMSKQTLNDACRGIGQDYCPDYDSQNAKVKIHFLQSDYQPNSMRNFFNSLHQQIQDSDSRIRYVLMFNGVLHNDTLQPEKKIEDISLESIKQVIDVNTLIPMIVLQSLAAIANHHWPTKIVTLSARVGSISDNRLGGWYSYRASKAALNMLFKTAAIEFKRRAKQCKLIAFHPGTTDTPLSKPFQQHVKQGALFSPEFVAQCLFDVIDELQPDGELSFVDWQGKTINW